MTGWEHDVVVLDLPLSQGVCLVCGAREGVAPTSARLRRVGPILARVPLGRFVAALLALTRDVDVPLCPGCRARVNRVHLLLILGILGTIVASLIGAKIGAVLDPTLPTMEDDTGPGVAKGIAAGFGLSLLAYVLAEELWVPRVQPEVVRSPEGRLALRLPRPEEVRRALEATGASATGEPERGNPAGRLAFALDLLRKTPGDANAFFSPESVAVALGMTALGARGATRAAFDAVLHGATGSPGVSSLEGEGFTFRAANRLFGQGGHPFVPAFLEAIGRTFGGTLAAVDFRDPRTREAINAWVSGETRGKIPELLAPGTIAPESRLVLVNAVYFLAKWLRPFESHLTAEGPFHLSSRRDVRARFMNQVSSFAYAEDATAQLVVLPYRGGRFEAILLLPRGPLAPLEASLSVVSFETLRCRAAPERVWVKVPRFQMAWGKELVPELSALGLAPACSPATADFSGISDVPGEPFFIGAVIHKAVVAFDEEGTEAAAATAVALRAGGAPQPPIPFEADRPFLLLIRDVASGAPLFLGRVADPTAT